MKSVSVKEDDMTAIKMSAYKYYVQTSKHCQSRGRDKVERSPSFSAYGVFTWT